MSVTGAGEPIARGRDAAVYALGDGRVLRRYRGPGPTGREMRVMAWARSYGYPVPRVYERTETDLILDRLDGPTMLADLARRPWRLHRHARTLAGLHRQLHGIPAPAELPAPLGEGGSLVHLDQATSGRAVTFNETISNAAPCRCIRRRAAKARDRLPRESGPAPCSSC